MNKEKAIAIIASKYPNKDIDTVTETNKYFLISIVAKRNVQDDSIVLTSSDDGLKAVDRSTGQVFTYNPIRHGGN